MERGSLGFGGGVKNGFVRGKRGEGKGMGREWEWEGNGKGMEREWEWDKWEGRKGKKGKGDDAHGGRDAPIDEKKAILTFEG